MRTVLRALTLFPALLLSLGGSAVADQVHLTNGKVMEGKARELADGRVQVELAFGTVTLPGDKVERIERGETLEELVRETLKGLPPSDTESRFDLALWTREQGAHTLSRQILEEILALDPNHPGARRALGFRLHEGRWVTEEDYHAARGEILYDGQWLPALTVHRLLAENAVRNLEARRSAAQRAEVAADYARLALAQETARRETVQSDYGLPFYPSYGPTTLYGVPVITVPVGSHPAGSHQPQSEPRPSRRPAASPRTNPHAPQHHSTTLKKY